MGKIRKEINEDEKYIDHQTKEGMKMMNELNVKRENDKGNGKREKH